MFIIPAIDLISGKVVRLTQGDYSKVKVYSENPVDIAKLWKDKGAEYLHIVDLDGAKRGKLANLKSVKEVIDSVDIKVELGGGIRDLSSINEALDIGVTKVVLGTAVFKDKVFAKECVSKFGEKVVFSIDARNKAVSLNGWTKNAESDLYDFIKLFESIGLKRIIYTDILKDGMMEGPNFESLEDILKMTKMEVIASGGISGVSDIERLKAFEPKGLKGVIIGKALYEGKINLEDALNAG